MNKAYCSVCKGLDDASSDCEHCNGTGKEPMNKAQKALYKEFEEILNKPLIEYGEYAGFKILNALIKAVEERDAYTLGELEELPDLNHEEYIQKCVRNITKLQIKSRMLKTLYE